jgi:Zn-dependent peptidase ImmA (M78 family)
MNDKKEVWGRVEEFRREYLGDAAQEVPVDVFSLCEITLRLDVIPFDGLLIKYGIDAGIVPDFTGIYVDTEAYTLWEDGPVWKQNRLRFSVAHELGHFALHREIVANCKFESLEMFQKWSKDDKYGIEQCANEFAGRLLVPIATLTDYYDAFGGKCGLPAWRTNSRMRRNFALRAAPKFGVNADVIEVRLDREGLWPAT